MATNFYTYYAIKGGNDVLELCKTRKEANECSEFWTGRKGGIKIQRINFEAVCLNGKIYIPEKYKPEFPMWLKQERHEAVYG